MGLEDKGCDSCKHFHYDNNQAHKNRCLRLVVDGESTPVAMMKGHGCPCQGGRLWEAKDAQ